MVTLDHGPVPADDRACVPCLSCRSSSWRTGCVPWDMSGVSAMPTGGITHTMGVGQCWGSSGCSCPHPKPRFCAAVRALRVICACAEGYYWAQEPAPEARPQPGAAAM